MMNGSAYEDLVKENAALRSRLREAEDSLEAIQSGQVDALVVSDKSGVRPYTLKSADSPYRLIVENMKQGAVTLSIDGIVLYCNDFFAELLECSVAAVISQNIDAYLAPEDGQAFWPFLNAIQTRGAIYKEFHLYVRKERMIPVYVSGSLIELDEMRVYCLVFTDLRERKQAEAQALALETEKQRTQVLAAFMRDTSHDFRTPISVILTGLSNIERTQDEDKRKEKIRTIEMYVSYLNSVLEKLQHTAILDALKELRLESQPPSVIIQEAIEACEDEAKEKDITLVEEVEAHIPSICLDADYLYHALVETLRNAILFSPAGRQVYIRCKRTNENQITIEVIDQGNGIPNEDIPFIFDRFFRGDKSRHVSGGVGLGLAIVKRTVELHKGAVQVESIPGQGTTIRLQLPIKTPTNP